MFDFNILDAIESKQSVSTRCENESSVKVLKFETQHFEKINNVKTLCGRLPAAGEMMMLWTLNSFNAFTFIVYAIKRVGRIRELTFSTYSLNERILSSLCKWYDKGEIDKINIFISDSIKHRTPKIYDLLCSQSSARNINITYAWNHSKIILIDAGSEHLVIEGSGNFSENALHEQYIFLNDERAYQFRYDCLTGSR